MRLQEGRQRAPDAADAGPWVVSLGMVYDAQDSLRSAIRCSRTSSGEAAALWRLTRLMSVVASKAWAVPIAATRIPLSRSFRYNHREGSDGARTIAGLKKISGKRLMLKRTGH